MVIIYFFPICIRCKLKCMAQNATKLKIARVRAESSNWLEIKSPQGKLGIANEM